MRENKLIYRFLKYYTVFNTVNPCLKPDGVVLKISFLTLLMFLFFYQKVILYFLAWFSFLMFFLVVSRQIKPLICCFFISIAICIGIFIRKIFVLIRCYFIARDPFSEIKFFYVKKVLRRKGLDSKFFKFLTTFHFE